MAEAKPEAELASANGEPTIALSAPLLPIENAETVFKSEICESGKLVAYKAVPDVLTVRPYGLPAGNGDPAMGVRTPLAPILKTAMLLAA